MLLTKNAITLQEKSLSSEWGIKVSNLATFHDGFSFTVPTELEAYKVAHKYQNCRRTIVIEAPNVNAWLVQVYVNDESKGVG